MLRPVPDCSILVRIATQLRITLHLRSCEDVGGQQMVFQVSFAKPGLGSSDDGRRRIQAAWRYHSAREQPVKFGFLRNELLPQPEHFGSHIVE
jgi:hypothetical protein